MEWIKLLLFTAVGFMVQCAAMSMSELEDFANFLKKTSQLDDSLKKGTDPNDFDEDDAISDHAWEDSGKFEGDLILNDRQRRTIVEDIAEGLSRNGLRDSTKRWPDAEVIFYIQRDHFSGAQVEAILSGIEDLAQASCVKFRPYRKGDRDAVVIQGNRRGCFSQVGYQGGYQVLNLSGRHPVGRGCFRHGTVVHELLHTLGFYHMQSSFDRDDYVNVVWENIVQSARHNFRKYNAFSVSDFGVGYDYDSVLHYSRRAFSSNGQDTIVPKQSGAQIGQRVGLSDKDAQKLNKMYCDADSSNDQGEENVQKPTNKKKNHKNKPFEGHGIGYHQGKTVVIKLLPAAKTFHIVNKPVFRMFDSFSKTSEILPTKKSEDFGIKYGVTDSYKPLTSSKGLYNQAKLEIQDLNNIKPENNLDKNTTKPNNEVSATQNKTTNKLKGTSAENEDDTDISSEFIDDELRAAIKRLTKILKTHVYPTNTPDLSIYEGVNTDYSEFADPNKIPKIARNYNMPLKSEDNNDDKGLSAEYIKSLYNDGPLTLNSEKKKKNYGKLQAPKDMYELLTPVNEKIIPKEEEALYRTAYPFKLHKHLSNGSLELQTPEYAAYENIKDKNDYSKLYSPYAKSNDDDTAKGKHKLLGEYAPIYDDWYKNDKHRRHPVDYDRESFSFVSPKKSAYRAFDASESSEYDPNSSNEYYTGSYSPQKKQAYSLFDAPVPLTRDWYKVDHEKLTNYPYKYYHPTENLESNESQEIKR